MLAGCNNASNPARTNPAASAAADGDEPKDASPASPAGARKTIIPVRRGVTTFDGNWVLVKTLQGEDKFRAIIGFSKDQDGKFKCQLVDSVIKEAELSGSTVDDKSVKFKFKEQPLEEEFQGGFDGIVIRGTLWDGMGEPVLSRLLPTDASRLEGYAATAMPPGVQAFQQLFQQMQNRPQPQMVLQVAREYRTSPLALEAVRGVIRISQQARIDDEALKVILADYLALAKLWGPRMELFAEMQCAQQFVVLQRMPELALEHLDAVEKLVPDNLSARWLEPWKQRIQLLREEANIQKLLAQSQSKSEEERAAANVQLRDALKLQPFNANILLALAEYANETRQIDAAIEYYSAIAALPMLEPYLLLKRMGQPAGDSKPSDVLKKLWIERYGSEESLAAHLTRIYDGRLRSLREEIRERGPAPFPADVGDHTVLVEFFTSLHMPTAVAPELAMDVLRESYPASKVIILRYHQHNPVADGLANQDSEDRLVSYEKGIVPVVALDGAMLAPEMMAGPLQVSNTLYGNLRALIDPRLNQPTPVRIELQSQVADGEISIQASVSGVSEDLLPACRLRLAIAEADVELPSLIGIRHHQMVVREMPGGAKGIAPRKGELKYSLSMPLGELQKHVDDYLNRYQAGKGIQFPPANRPAIRGPLYLVAWVQNDKLDEKRPDVGRAILQAAIVPVPGTGELNAPADAAAPSNEAPSKPMSDSPPPPALPE